MGRSTKIAQGMHERSIKNMPRSERRAELKRIKKARKNYWGRFWICEKMNPRQLGIVAGTPAVCGCWMCTGPKKHTYSIQELKLFQNKLQDFDLDSED